MQDDVLASSYSQLAFELRSLQALVTRFIQDKQCSRSSLLVPQDIGPLLSRLQKQQEADGCLGGEGSERRVQLLAP